MSDEKPRKFAEGGVVSGSAEPLFKPDRCEPIIPAAVVREVGKALRRIQQERDLARAELASARQELDAVRTARDNLDRELAEARATIRALTRTPEEKS